MTSQMKVFTAVMIGFLCVSRAHGTEQPFACNLKALNQDERISHKELSRQLFSSVVQRKEISDGYSFRINPDKTSMLRVAEWVNLEAKCCPFFRFQIDVDGQDGTLWLTLKGREGVKKFIELEFRE
jgi:hypothetical protein